MAMANLASILEGRAAGKTGGTGINVVNNPGYSVGTTNQFAFSPNLGNTTQKQREGYYQAGDFSALPQILNSTGLSLGAVTNDFNTVMGANVNPVEAAMAVYGFTPQQVAGLLTSDPSQAAAVANQLGINATDLSSWYNNYAGTNVTPDQASAFLSKSPSTTTNLFDQILNAKGPSSQSSSSGGGSSFSGMDWSKSPVSFSQLQTLAGNLPGLAAQFGDTLQNRYMSLMKEAMGDKGNFAGVLNEMGGRNIMGSTMQSDALSKTASNIATDIGDKAYQSTIAGLNAQMDVPKTLASIANLGQVSSSQNSSSSSSISDPGTLQNLTALMELLGGSMFQ